MSEKKYESLFKPFKIGTCTIKNRFSVAPMFMPFLMNEDASYTADGMEYLVEKAKGGFGLIIPGCIITDTTVDVTVKDNAPVPIEHPASFIRSSRDMISRVHAYGSKVFAELCYGNGRNMDTIGQASGDIPNFWDRDSCDHELTVEEIKRKVQHMIDSAVLMKEAGYDGVEVHSLHWGYLLDNFSMSLYNHRTDEYGGSLENRHRICKELVEGIKAACGKDYPVIIRFSIKSFIKDINKGDITGKNDKGRTVEEIIKIGQLLESWGYDGFDCDAGSYEAMYYASPASYIPEGFFMDVSKQLKDNVSVPVIYGGGRNNNPDLADRIVCEGYADAVAYGRQSLADPYYPEKIRIGKTEKIRRCLACNVGCQGGYFAGNNPACAINPSVNRPVSYGLKPISKKKNIIVVGGGVAGMEAARTAKLRGHDVSVYEKDSQLGGHLIPGGNHSFKYEMRMLNEWYQRELRELNVPVYLEHELNAEEIIKLAPDAVILATGSSPFRINLPGIDNPKAIGCEEFLRSDKVTGENVTVVGGGLTGCEIALELAQEGKKVTVVEAMDKILGGTSLVPWMTEQYMVDAYELYGVNVLTGHRIEAVSDEGAVLKDKEGNIKTVAADNVILALGYRPNRSMQYDFVGTDIEVYQIGDANKVADIKNAIWDGYEIARSI